MNILPNSLFKEEYFGLSLTSTVIRAVVLSPSRKTTSVFEVPLEPGVFSQSGIQSEALTQSLQQILSQANSTTKYVSVSIPDYYSFTRTYKLPLMPLDEVSSALNWQLEQILPLPKESVYFDWALIEKNEEGLDVSIIAMARTLLDVLIETFEAAGLKPLTFEPSTSALTRTVPPKDHPVILVEINPQGSSVTLIQDRVAHLTITNQFESSNPTETQAAFQKTSQSIQSLITYCANTNPTLTDSIELLLTGESSSNEVSQWLQSILQKPVNLLDIPEVSPQYHQAFAAATGRLPSVEKNKSVNLLPDIVRELYTTTRIYQAVTKNFKISFIVILVSCGLSVLSLILSMNKVNTSSSELLQLESVNSGYSYDSKEIVSINQNSQTVVKAFPKKTTPVDQIGLFFEQIEEGMSLTSFSFDRAKEQFKVTGKASQREQLLDFVARLESMEEYKNVILPIEALEKPTNIDFSITIVLAKKT